MKKNRPRFNELIWDFDGTLFDTYPAMSRAFKEALARFGLDRTEEEIYQKLKVSLQHALEYYAAPADVSPETLLSVYRVRKDPIEETQARPFPGARTLCSRVVGAQARNFILTHKERSITWVLLEKHRMLHLFTDIVGSDNGFPRKPDPEGFNHLIQQYGLNRQKTMAVGDRALDIQAARSAGVWSCLIGSPTGEHHGADFHVRDLGQLETLLFG